MGGPGKKRDESPDGGDKPAYEGRANELVQEFKESEGVDEGGEHVAQELVKERAEELSESLERNLFQIHDFNERLDFLRKHWESREELKPEEKREYVLTARRKLIELRFLLWYARNRAPFEIKRSENGHEVYTEKEGVTLDLTGTEESISEIEKGVAGIKEGEQSIYENIERRRDTIKPRDFLKLPIEQRLILVSNIKSWDELKDGGLLVFNFGTNQALEYQIGLGDLMPPEYRSMTLNGVVYKRRGNQGFYNNGRYLAIFNGTRVTVGDKVEGYSAEKEYASRFGDSYKSEEENIDGPEGKREVTRKDILEVAHDFSVDAHFLEAVLAIMRNDNANAVSDDYEFLHIAARYIQNAESKFEEESGSPLENDHYNGEFVLFAVERFNLFSTYIFGKRGIAEAIVSKYGALCGVDIKLPVKKEPAPRVERSSYAGADRHDQGDSEVAVESSDASSGTVRDSSRVFEHSVDDGALDILSGLSAREGFVDFRTDYSGSRFRLRDSAFKCYEYARTVAKANGFDLKITSAYRTVAQQQGIYARSSQPGTLAAAPGKSWHHSGGAIDITLVDPDSGKDLCRSGSAAGRRRYQKLLEYCMDRAGFVRYSVEWWHFELGSSGWYGIMKKKGLLATSVSKGEVVYSRRA